MGGERHAPAALLPGNRLSTHCTGDWMGPRAVLKGAEHLPPHQLKDRGISFCLQVKGRGWGEARIVCDAMRRKESLSDVGPLATFDILWVTLFTFLAIRRCAVHTLSCLKLL